MTVVVAQPGRRTVVDVGTTLRSATADARPAAPATKTRPTGRVSSTLRRGHRVVGNRTRPLLASNRRV